MTDAKHRPLDLTVKESAEMLELPRFKIYFLLQDKVLDGFKIGSDWRVLRVSVERLLGHVS